MMEFKRVDLRDYQISPQLGFLPSEPPLTRLHHPYYRVWEETIQRFPSPCSCECIRQQLDKMPVLSTAALVGEPEWRRAYVVLSMLAQIYIWSGAQPRSKLPKSLAVPLCEVSVHLRINPCASFASFCLWNVVPIAGYSHRPEDLAVINSFTGTKDEEWFFCVSVSIEAVGGRMIPKLLDAIEAAHYGRLQQVNGVLDELAACLKQITGILDRMYEKCAPSVFYHQVRKFVNGSKSVTTNGASQGVFYEAVDGSGQWHQHAGGSNAQSSLIQLFDIFLGIEHSTATGEKARSTFHQEMRDYMPGPHRDFLSLVSRISNIRPLVLRQTSGSEIRASYDRAVSMLAHLRQRHLIMASRYIITPAAKERGTYCLEGLQGTGGTNFMRLLKDARDNTQASAGISLTH